MEWPCRPVLAEGLITVPNGSIPEPSLPMACIGITPNFLISPSALNWPQHHLGGDVLRRRRVQRINFLLRQWRAVLHRGSAPTKDSAFIGF